MKIDRLETFRVPPRWLFVRIETDDGIVGWGEPVVEGQADAVERVVHTMAERLIGEDPTRIEHHWQVLTKSGFYRGGPLLSSAVAGIDQALWDITGKLHGVGVHELLGGPVRDRVRVYSWAGGDAPAEVGERAAELVSSGLTAIKMNGAGRTLPLDSPAATRAVVSRAEAVRAAIGSDRDVAIDFHGRFSPAMARRVLPMLEHTMPLFVEEPVLPELTDRLSAVTSSTTIPIATGERLYSRWDFREVLDSGIAVVQPDLSHAGGISEVRRIAAMAETYGVLLAPHCPLGPIALAASVQVDLATPNFVIQEHGLGIHYNTDHDLLDYVLDTTPLRPVEGYLPKLVGPGLGIEIDEQAVRGAAAHRWRPPVWFHDDGSLAEW